jgi:hypothetical protein
MGAEFRGKGRERCFGQHGCVLCTVHSEVILTCSEGRQAAAGHDWADPFLSGVATVATIHGIQSNGIVKHLCVLCSSIHPSIYPSIYPLSPSSCIHARFLSSIPSLHRRRSTPLFSPSIANEQEHFTGGSMASQIYYFGLGTWPP